MPDPDQTGTLISPTIDDELVLTVRIRLDDADVLHRVQGYLLDAASARLYGSLTELLNRPGMELAGVEIVTPTFKPYHTVYQRNSEPTPEIG
jgi:hypothetical protein